MSIHMSIFLLQMFRSIALLSLDSLPAGIQTFYLNLGLVTLDFEFAQPGACSCIHAMCARVCMCACVHACMRADARECAHMTACTGCGGTASDFVSLYFFNIALLLTAGAPILFFMPLLIFIGHVIENQAGILEEETVKAEEKGADVKAVTTGKQETHIAEPAEEQAKKEVAACKAAKSVTEQRPAASKRIVCTFGPLAEHFRSLTPEHGRTMKD